MGGGVGRRRPLLERRRRGLVRVCARMCVRFSVLHDLQVKFLDFVVQVVDGLHVLLGVFDEDCCGSVCTFKEPVLIVAFFLEVFDLLDKLRDDLRFTNLLFCVGGKGSVAAVEAEGLVEQHVAVRDLLIGQMDV